MQAEIVSIGTELLLGELVDTNAAWIARQLAAIGLDVYYKTTVGDNASRITGVLRQALARSDVVITTGGLGPTVDDVTRQAVAAATGRELVFKEELLAHIEALFRRFGSPMSDNNRRQAYVPAGSIVVENPVGTAPAFIVETEAGMVISLPGVPREMKYLMEKRVLPFLREHVEAEVIASRILRTCGIGESAVDSRIADLMRSHNPTVGLAAHPGQTDVRITAKAASQAQAEALIAEMEKQVRERLGDFIYGTGQQTPEEIVAALLAERGLTLAVAETNTRGLIAQRLSQAAEGKQLLQQAVTASEAEAIADGLGLPPAMIEAHGLISQSTAIAAAEHLRQTSGADLAVAVLGSMEDGEGLYEKRAGATFVALSTPEGTAHKRLKYGGTDDFVQSWVSNHALDIVRRHLIRRGEEVRKDE